MLTISDREREVLKLIAYEYTMQQIATSLFVSHHTIISHRKNLMVKLKARNTAGLIRRAFEVGVLVTQKQHNFHANFRSDNQLAVSYNR